MRALILKPGPVPTQEVGQGATAFTFLGTAGFIVEHRDRCFVLDPYLTRAGLLRTAFGRLVPDEVRLARHIPHAHEVLVGHAHHDHALDAPAVARRTGARLCGSHATMQIAIAAGLPEAQRVEVQPGTELACGAAKARAWASRHGKALFGRVPLPGDILAPPAWPPRATALRHGQVLHWELEVGGLRVLHVDSADFYEEALPDAVDVLLLCAVGRQYRPDYTRRMLARTRPKVVIPCHWDDFSTPIEAPPRQLPGVDVEAFTDEIRAGGARPVLLSPLQTWRC